MLTDKSSLHRSPNASGRCLCDSVIFQIHGPMRQVVACHCRSCRRWHGHFAAYSRVLFSDLLFLNETGLRWYRSSVKAQRGFCCNCGSSMFWRPNATQSVAVSAGSLDDPINLTLVGHIYCDERGDYYRLDDELPKYGGTSAGAFDHLLMQFERTEK